jgi:hypothetical protein
MGKIQDLANRVTFYSLIGWIPSILIFFFSVNTFEVNEEYYLPSSFVITTFVLLLFSRILRRKKVLFTPRSLALELLRFAIFVSFGMLLNFTISHQFILALAFITMSILSIYVFRREVEAN